MANVSLVVGFNKPVSSHSLGSLHRKFKIRQDEKLKLINGYSIDVPEDKVDEYLDALPESASVIYNKPFFTESTDQNQPTTVRDNDLSDGEDEVPHISRPAGMEAVHEQGFTGKGTTIAVVDSGISRHSDFGDRVSFYKDFQRLGNRVDRVGHGSHVAGLAAGDGEFMDGVAPEADLVGLGIGDPEQAIKAVTWAVKNKDKYGIDVLNLSLGVTQVLPDREDPFAIAAQAAIDAGIITIVASGNECTEEQCSRTISSPGSLPDAITVGAYYDGETTHNPDDDVMYSRSSNGPTAVGDVAKPDLVAPGVRVYGPKTKGSHLTRIRPVWDDYHMDSGSSMATPMVAGTAALLLQVDPDLTQDEIKEILTDTADPMDGVTKFAQGAGRLNLVEALRSAGADIDYTSPSIN